MQLKNKPKWNSSLREILVRGTVHREQIKENLIKASVFLV